MSQRSKRLTDAARWPLGAVLLALTGPAATAQAAPVVEAPYANDYMLVNLGPVDGVPAPYGGLTFVPGDPNTIILTGLSGAATATLDTVGLTRDSTGSITAFAGPGTLAAQAYAASGGLAYGPGGVLFCTRSTFKMGEFKPGSSTTDKVVSLRGLTYHVGGLNFVPPGLGGAGTLKLVTVEYGDFWSLPLTPDANGTYDVAGGTKGPSLPGYPAGFAYVAPGTPGFISPGALVCEKELSYGAGKVSWYDVDQHGDPDPTTRSVVVSGLDVPNGIALDPLTGDVLFGSYQGWLYLLRHAPFPPTTSTVPTTTTTTSTTKPPTTTTSSSTTLHATSTTVPTTTSTTIVVPTTTSTTSTTARPTTTSTSSTTSSTIPTTVSTSTATTSSSTTTTVPGPCGVAPSFEWIGCRLDALLALVRASSALGPFQTILAARVDQARATIADGTHSCAAGRSALTRNALQRVERQMALLRERMRRVRARRTIPRPLAERIGDEARGIGTDARTLRGSLACP